jgi:hypothetical protein
MSIVELKLKKLVTACKIRFCGMKPAFTALENDDTMDVRIQRIERILYGFFLGSNA